MIPNEIAILLLAILATFQTYNTWVLQGEVKKLRRRASQLDGTWRLITGPVSLGDRLKRIVKGGD